MNLQASVPSKIRDGARAAGLPFIHAVVLDCLLKSAEPESIATGSGSSESSSSARGPRSLLDALVRSNVTDLEALLRPYTASRVAAECLWKYHAQHDQPARASAVLLHLAEWSDQDCKLQDRIRYLDLAVGQARLSASWRKEAVAEQALRLEVAKKVQAPLLFELSSIAENKNLDQSRCSAARQSARDLEQLCDVRDLYQIALEFGLFHIVLVIADMRDEGHDREDLSWAWVSVFCPPAACVYWVPSASKSTYPPAHTSFPLLMVRQGNFFSGTSFYRLTDADTPRAHSSLDAVSAPGANALRLRAMALLEELQLVTNR